MAAPPGSSVDRRWIVLYDGDCGFCKWLLAGLLRLDRAQRLRPVALQRPEADALLADLAPAERMASWHLVAPDGARLSGGHALPPLLRLLPGGRFPAAVLTRFPGLTAGGYRWVAAHRTGISRFVPRGAKRRAAAWVRERERTETKRTIEEATMDEVRTELDERFSDPGATAVSWEETERAIREAQLFWISTVRRDGRPHVTPLVAVWSDGALHFCTGPEEQKAINLAANPHVVLTTGCNTWERGLDVVVEGDAERVADEPTLQDLARAWATKWDGQWQFEALDGEFRHGDGGVAHVFAVRPQKVLAFGKGAFSHTRHVF